MRIFFPSARIFRPTRTGALHLSHIIMMLETANDSFLFHDAPGLLWTARPTVPLNHIDSFDNDSILLGEDAKDFAGFSPSPFPRSPLRSSFLRICTRFLLDN